MRTKRINTDIYDSLELKNSSDGSALDLTDAYDMHLYLRRDGSSVMLEQVFTITDNKIYYQYNSKENNALGVYNLHFYYKKNNANSENGYDQYHFDVFRIFTIVKSSEEENWAGGITGVFSQYGADGLSAYQLAVRDGFAGTEAEWLESLKLHFQDLTQTDITLLQKPAADKADELDSKLSDTTEFLRLADLAEEERGTNESERISNENARKQSEDSREQAENLRATAENARKQSEDSRISAETSRVAAEASRATAESGRATAESARETSFSESKTAADEATEAANAAATAFNNAIVQVTGQSLDKVMSQKAVSDAISAIQNQFNTLLSGSATTAIDTFNEIIAFLSNLSDSSTLEGIISAMQTTIANNLQTAKNYADSAVSTHNASGTAHTDLFNTKLDKTSIVQIIGSNTDKVISQNALTVLLNAITDNASLQGNVIAEAIVLLINEVNGLKSILSQGLGDIRVTSITSDNIPQYRGQSTIVTGSGSPVTNAVLPAFEGQIYIDTTNRNVYMCSDSSSATYWKQLN